MIIPRVDGLLSAFPIYQTGGLKMNSETVMMQEIWRKAFRAGEDGLEIVFKTKAGATRGRMRLYNAMKGYKKDCFDDMELRRAAQEIEIVWLDATTIKMQMRSHSDMMQTLQAVAGAGVSSFEDPEIAASAERMLEMARKIGEPSEDIIEHKDNTYYGKREPLTGKE